MTFLFVSTKRSISFFLSCRWNWLGWFVCWRFAVRQVVDSWWESTSFICNKSHLLTLAQVVDDVKESRRQHSPFHPADMLRCEGEVKDDTAACHTQISGRRRANMYSVCPLTWEVVNSRSDGLFTLHLPLLLCVSLKVNKVFNILREETSISHSVSYRSRCLPLFQFVNGPIWISVNVQFRFETWSDVYLLPVKRLIFSSNRLCGSRWGNRTIRSYVRGDETWRIEHLVEPFSLLQVGQCCVSHPSFFSVKISWEFFAFLSFLHLSGISVTLFLPQLL